MEVKGDLYKDMLRRIAQWVGLSAEEATLSELHERVVEQDAVIEPLKERVAKLEGALNQASEQISSLQAIIHEHAKVIEEHVATIAHLKEERDKAIADLNGASVALEAQIASNQKLAEEVARLRAGMSGPIQNATDRDDQFAYMKRPGSGGTVIPAGELFNRLKGN